MCVCAYVCVLLCRWLYCTENPQPRQFEITQFQTGDLKKEVKKNEVVTYLVPAPIFLLAGIKAQLEEGDGRILLGDNTGDGAVVLLPIRFQCAGVWITSGLTCVYK